MMNKIWKSQPCHTCGKRHPQFQMLAMKFSNGVILGYLCKTCKKDLDKKLVIDGK